MTDYDFGFWPVSRQSRINLSPKTGSVEVEEIPEVETIPVGKLNLASGESEKSTSFISFSFFWLEPKGGLSVKKQPSGLF